MPRHTIFCDICYERTEGQGGIIELQGDEPEKKALAHLNTHTAELPPEQAEKLGMEKCHGRKDSNSQSSGQSPASSSSKEDHGDGTKKN